ncbi:MAG: tetratricopeptide repeat protein [Candidatus Poribacteria bacterium]|nr:tetratricopeptide repeat protein [Candidatus Poribacteria bacterium]
MKSNLWKIFILLSIVCLFSARGGADAQELISSTTAEQVPLTEASESGKKIYTQLMYAIYLQSFDRDLDAVKRLYDALVEQVPESAYVWYKRGQLRFHRLQDVKGAEDDTLEALKLNPSHVPANWLLAEILMLHESHSRGNYIVEALKAAKKVTELDPDHLGAHQRVANLASELQEYAAVETSLKALTRILPFEPEFHRRLGRLYLITNKPLEAIDAYQRVIKITPNDLMTLRIVGRLYLDTGKLAEAEQTFKHILTLVPQDVGGNLGLGLVLQRLAEQALASSNKDPKSEKTDLQTLIRDAETYLGRAIFFSKDFINNPRNDVQRAYFERLAIDAQFALANVYFLYKKYEKAEETFEQLLADNPEHTGATYGIAAVYQTIGAFEKAETYLRKTLKIEPGHEYALNALGYLFAVQEKNLDEAEALVKRALEKSPTNGAYLDSLGWVYFKQGRIAEAVTLLEEANQQLPDNAEILMHLGDAYLENGEPDKARGVWQQAQTIEPDNDDIQERLKQ